MNDEHTEQRASLPGAIQWRGLLISLANRPKAPTSDSINSDRHSATAHQWHLTPHPFAARASETEDILSLNLATKISQRYSRDREEFLSHLRILQRSDRKMFLRNCWYVLAQESELTTDNVIARRILNEPVILYQTAQGAPVVLLDRCPHRLAPLSAGRRISDSIQCGYHGLTFSADGQCVHIPGQNAVPEIARVQTYPSSLRHGYVWVWMGTPEAADPALIPNVPWPKLAGWVAARGYSHFAADYRLLTDNLLDLSHENYLHEKTIGNSATQTIADYPVHITARDEQVIHARRIMSDIDPPPFFAMILGSNRRIDRWQTAIWQAPAINLTDTKAREVGAAEESAYIGRVLHLLTPETETSTHYFWSLSRNYRLGDDALTQSLHQSLAQTFDEDKHMIELQQKVLREVGGDVPKLALRMDHAPVRARRMLDSLIKLEQAGKRTIKANIWLVDEAQ